MSLTEQGNSAAAVSGDDAAGSPTADSGVGSAGSPVAEGAKSMMDAVLTALDGPEDSPASTEPGAQAGQTDEQNPAHDTQHGRPEGDETSLSAEEEARLGTRVRERISDLTAQRRALREQVASVQTELDQIKPHAENFAKIQEFMHRNDLSPQDAGQAMTLAALVQTDPVAAFKALQPIYARLAEIAGAALPSDLSEDVRLGRMTQERARELAATRAAVSVRDQRTQRQQERQAEDTQRQQAEARERHAGEMSRLGDALAAETAKTDPEWKLKEPLVARALQVDLVTNGMPTNADDLRKRFNAAVKEVTQHVSAFRPAVKASQRSAIGGSSATTVQAPAPKTLQDAVLRALD